MGCKATETTHNIINTQAQELLTNVQCSDGLRSFAKETRDLKTRSRVASYWKLTMTNWEQSSKLILLQLCEKLLKNSVLTILLSFGMWSKLGVKALISGCLASWLQIRKIVLKCGRLSFYSTTNKPFLYWIVTCNKKWILYDSQWWPLSDWT